MSIFEYDEEKHMKSERKVGREEGKEIVVQLLQNLVEDGKTEEIFRVISDREYREKMLLEKGEKDYI